MKRDEFYWLTAINKATILVNREEGLVTDAVAQCAAKGVRLLERRAEEDANLRVKTYIKYEPLWIAETSPDVTILHAGRSSQDMLSTVRMAIDREEALRFATRFDEVLAKLTDLADAHRETIVPNYTNGVAAQPNSYAHYLLGFLSSFLRDRKRLAQCLTRYNRSSMGATVLNGTGWPLNRDAMARHLGFDEPLRNAFDCTCQAPVDFPVELAQIMASVALHVGSFICDVMVQYAQPRPWILLAEGGDNTYVSSAMPQKRNPGLLNNCRADASSVVGELGCVMLRAHNLVPGMVDGKSVALNTRMMETAVAMLEKFLKVLSGLRINAERALEELNSDWTASQEIADRLMKDHGLPFRIGHHMASRMVSVARSENILPLDFPYERMQALYREEIEEEYPQGPKDLPMSEADFRDALDPRKIVANRRTKGSAAPSEVDAMIRETREAVASVVAERKTLEAQVEKALDDLEARFSTFLAESEDSAA